MPIYLTEQEKDFLNDEVELFRQSFVNSEIQPVAQAIRYGTRAPDSIKEFNDRLDSLQRAIKGPLRPRIRLEGDDDPIIKLDDDHAPIIKLVVFARRRVLAATVDERRAKTNNREIVAGLDAELRPYDDILTKEWLEPVSPARMPRLADYLTLEEMEQHFAKLYLRLRPRQFDEKFHTLQAPSLLAPDIAYYREVSTARGNAVAVAYLDIDDFKVLNTKYGHSIVDSVVLPIFMRALESFTFARGHAYRYGGDEYAILLANGQGAAGALQHLQKQLAELSYHDVREKTAISIGLCMVTSESFLTDQAVIERANLAMRHAKAQGRNRIATFEGHGMYRDQDLVIIP